MRSALALTALVWIAPAIAAAPAHPQVKPLDALFAALAKAGSEEAAAPIAKQIEALFLQSGGDTADLLMSRAAQALSENDTATAAQLIDAVTTVAPDYAEGWHQHARLQAAAGDDRAAMLSLRKTVALNPRQFEALAELGDMLADYGDKAGALAMYRRAIALNPYLQDGAARVRELERAVEGQRI